MSLRRTSGYENYGNDRVNLSFPMERKDIIRHPPWSDITDRPERKEKRWAGGGLSFENE
jgi:hypothetical protein